MTAFFLFLALFAVLAIAWNLLVAGGWPAAAALLAAFGADPTDPLRPLLTATVVFVALSLLRRA